MWMILDDLTELNKIGGKRNQQPTLRMYKDEHNTIELLVNGSVAALS